MKKSAKNAAAREAIRRAYDLMSRRHGHQGWWPGDTPFEICVGAILTQNTNWGNVERAIANLKAAGAMSPEALHELPDPELARLIRPAGYFNVKAGRLRAFTEVLVIQFGGSLERLFEGPTPVVRERLLAIKGVGPETADSMLLYAGNHHSFVVDAYTKRIFQSHRWWTRRAGGKSKSGRAAKGNTREEYESIKALCEDALNEKPLEARLDYWQDYHAQLVMVGKTFCRPASPRCEECPLKELLPG